MSPNSGGQSDGVIVLELGIGEGHLLGESDELEPPLTALTGSEMQGAAVMVVEREGEVDVMVVMIPGDVKGAIMQVLIGDDGEEFIAALVHVSG